MRLPKAVGIGLAVLLRFFPDDWRRVPCDPCFAAVSRDRGRRGSHAYPSPLNGGIHTDPTDPAHDKSRRRTLCLHDGAWSTLSGETISYRPVRFTGKDAALCAMAVLIPAAVFLLERRGSLLIELKNLSFSYENSSEAKGQLRGIDLHVKKGRVGDPVRQKRLRQDDADPYSQRALPRLLSGKAGGRLLPLTVRTH